MSERSTPNTPHDAEYWRTRREQQALRGVEHASGHPSSRDPEAQLRQARETLQHVEDSK